MNKNTNNKVEYDEPTESAIDIAIYNDESEIVPVISAGTIISIVYLTTFLAFITWISINIKHFSIRHSYISTISSFDSIIRSCCYFSNAAVSSPPRNRM